MYCIGSKKLMEIEPTSVCAIILAYGSRKDQLKKVLAELIEQKVGHVIVVANAVIKNTLQMLYELSKIHEGKIEILISNENIGSAGGYNLGLNEAYKKSHDFLWLLDDDNLPQKDALTELLKSFSIHNHSIKPDKLILQSLRESLPEMKEIVRRGCSPALPIPASFIGFHVMKVWDMFFSKLSSDKDKSCSLSNNKNETIRLHSAPYGGLFFHKDVLKTLGFPNPLFFLYADDFAYTLNFTSQGGSILLVPNSRIIDLEPVWNATGSSIYNIYRRLKILTPEKVYYEVRNRIFIGRRIFPGHLLMYLVNKYLYLLALGFLTLYYRRFDRFRLILCAIHDGEQGFLGKKTFRNQK